jgi:two-component system OmpR family sensor kinase
LERNTVDLTSIVLEAVAAAGAVEADRPLDVRLGPEPVEVRGDPNRLRQVVDNLLTNVREHTPPATPASVNLSATNGTATVVIADKGPGMSEEEAAHAFDRFWQAGGDRGPSARGTGLGLSIVSEIVTAHGGSIRLDTSPGGGAAFVVTLPIAGSRNAQGAPRGNSQA